MRVQLPGFCVSARLIARRVVGLQFYGMARRLLGSGIAFLAAAYAACSGSTGPSPTIAGTWHVTVQSLYAVGESTPTLTPSTFDVIIKPATQSTFTVAMPPLVWSRGPVTYDTLPMITLLQIYPPDTSLDLEEWCKSMTCAISFSARLNQARDTLTWGNVNFLDTVTINNTFYLQTIPGVAGSFVAHK